ncbi:unnamed protein product [Paramecium pentaurelia]|uniref:Uncharacterized protein n=1 Tax=Paramecium pentaurelia TaxID=43138 RepID=A0A8S1YD60_9CILI|nr:unnamed protein product [Paramecium pentaurelia]
MGIICSSSQHATKEIELNISHDEYQAEHKAFENTLKEYEYLRRDYYHQGWMKTKFLVASTKTKELLYLKDGQILRIEQIKDSSNSLEVLNNLDQIKNLEWVGKYGKDSKKVGIWTAFWNGERLQGVGGFYSKDGLKQGIWKELRNNYSNYAPVYEIGEYINNQKRGIWKYILKNRVIGGGNYNDKGKRNGKWIELSNYFYRYQLQKLTIISKCQVSYVGEYKDGRKVVEEDFMLKHKKRMVSQKKESGLKNQRDMTSIYIGLKTYFRPSHISFLGEYKNGIKIGIWDIEHQYICNRKLGGGIYESQLNVDGLLTSIKVGKWIDLCDCFHYNRFITYEGEYKNGIKIGSWDIKWEQTKIGGGFYDDNNQDDIMEDSVKIGMWIEHSDTFNNSSQITHVGEYQNGKKHGKWDIYFRDYSNAGGQYEVKQKEGVFYSSKIGFWTEISELFENGRQIYYSGEYENGLKVGRWNTYFASIFWQHVQLIGGGYYSIDEKQDFLASMKTGKWIEFETEFFSDITSTGEYNYGRKVGRWDIWTKEDDENIRIGGGSYSEAGVKIGKWVDLYAKPSNVKLITYNGEYKNGKKVGRWDIEFRQDKDKPFSQIGGGSYNEKGDGIKIGQWIELKGKSKDETCNGEYQNGKKVGKWVVSKRDKNKMEEILQIVKEIKYDY